MVDNIRRRALALILFTLISAHDVCAQNVLDDSSGGPKSKGGGKSVAFIVQACLIPVLVILSGILAGLTLGYMSLDETQLRVLAVSGSAKQREYALKIEPIRKNGHLLLTTLLLGNMVVNETLPVISENVLGGGIQAVVVSTVLIVVFSEIIPQSLCSRFGLQIGAFMATPTRFLIYFLFVIAWPIAKLLEFVLGPHHGIVYRRNELKELINMHSAMDGHGGDLQSDTVTMVGGALDFQEKTAFDAMTPIKDVFMLSIESRLDYETLAKVVRSGHSRVPVFEEVTGTHGHVSKKIIGILLVKQCVLLDPEDATPLRDIPLNSVPTVPFNEPLLRILDRFQQGNSHMAIVSRIPSVTENKKVPGSINDEAKIGLTRRFLNRVLGDSSDSDTDTSDDETAGASTSKKRRGRKKSTGSTGSKGSKGSKKEAKVEIKVETPKKKETLPPNPNWMQWNRMDALEQTMPADAVLNSANADEFLQGLQRAPLGIITLEDVLEELIGEEILDEFDLKGASALPASSYVPAEAQRAVEKAARARAAIAKNLGVANVQKEKGGDPLGATPNSNSTKIAQGLRAMRLKAGSPATGAKKGGEAVPAGATGSPLAPGAGHGDVKSDPALLVSDVDEKPVIEYQPPSGLPMPLISVPILPIGVDSSGTATPATFDNAAPIIPPEIPMARGGSKGAKKRAFKSLVTGEVASPGLEKRGDPLRTPSAAPTPPPVPALPVPAVPTAAVVGRAGVDAHVNQADEGARKPDTNDAEGE